MDPRHLGSSFDDFLREDGLLEEVEAVAAKRVLDFKDSSDPAPSPLHQASTDLLENLRRDNRVRVELGDGEKRGALGRSDAHRR